MSSMYKRRGRARRRCAPVVLASISPLISGMHSASNGYGNRSVRSSMRTAHRLPQQRASSRLDQRRARGRSTPFSPTSWRRVCCSRWIPFVSFAEREHSTSQGPPEAAQQKQSLFQGQSESRRRRRRRKRRSHGARSLLSIRSVTTVGQHTHRPTANASSPSSTPESNERTPSPELNASSNCNDC